MLDRIAATAEGATDPAFWKSFFHYQSGSGPAVLTGWITVLFPYLVNFRDQEGDDPKQVHGDVGGESREARRRLVESAGPWTASDPAGLAERTGHRQRNPMG